MGNNSTKRILIIDDDKAMCETAMDYLSGEKMMVLAAHTGREGLALCSREPMDVVLLDQKLPDGEGVHLCESILEYNDGAKIIFITAYPNLENAIKAIRAGAYDYLSKPFELEELSLIIQRALRTVQLEKIEQFEKYKSHQENKRVRLPQTQEGLADVTRLIQLAAHSDVNVLITGETGSGKSLVAKAIHYGGALKDATFVSINCAALPENLIEAELFGFEKGAFSGALKTKRGIFEWADGGTLLLDEIGDIPLHLQSKLLSVLDEKKFIRLGGETVRYANARIIAATNANLEEAVRRKAFRSDLYYRLGVLTIHVPPLRERKQDLKALCRQFVDELSKGADIRIPEDEFERLCAHDWPGNVRELKNIIERSILIQKGPVIEPSRLLTGSPSAAASPPPLSAESILTLDEVEKQHIQQVLALCEGNLARSARALNISLSTLKRKVKGYGMSNSSI